VADEPEPFEFVILPAEDNVPADGADDGVEFGPDPRTTGPTRAVASLVTRPWLWGGAIVTLLVLGVVGVATHHPPRQIATPAPTGHPASSLPLSPSSATSASAAIGTPWPTARGACGNETFLPILSAATPLTERTGVRLTVGNRPRSVDIDTAQVTPLAGVTLAADEFVSQLATDPAGAVALIQRCDQNAPTRVVRIAIDGQVRQVGSGRIAGLLGGGSHVWGIQYSTDASGLITDGPISLYSLDGRPAATLPSAFGLVGAYRDLIIGYQSPPAAAAGTSAALVLLDPRTSRVKATIGPATAAAAVGANLVVWTTGACPAPAPCRVHRYDLATGQTSTRDYDLAVGTYIGYGLISPDGRLLAFPHHRAAPDPRYNADHPGTPSDIAVLHLDTGEFDLIPGVELWAKSTPGLAFSSDSRWLIICLEEGTHSTLLLWRPGLSHPAAPPVTLPGPTLYNPPIIVRATTQR